MPTAKMLMADTTTKTAVRASRAIPILLRLAMQGRSTMTYLELKRVVQPDFVGHWALDYRYLAGRVGDICHEVGKELGERVPPLNALIVNGKTGLPSEGVDGYLAQFLGLSTHRIRALDDGVRDDYARRAVQDVFDYDGWRRVGRYLAVKAPSPGPKPPIKKTGPARPDPKKFARGPESPGHKALKEWVLAHPAEFAAWGTFPRGRKEAEIDSGDRLDVLFEAEGRKLAVEVKCTTSPTDEIMRGVFQVVKYRAVLRAMQLVEGYPPNAHALLVIDGPAPSSVIALAGRLTVRVLNAGKPPMSIR